MRDRRRFEGADAYRFAILNAASKKRFERGPLGGREISGIADHIEILRLQSYEFTLLRPT